MGVTPQRILKLVSEDGELVTGRGMERRTTAKGNGVSKGPEASCTGCWCSHGSRQMAANPQGLERNAQ